MSHFGLLRETVFLRAFSIFKIPLIFYLSPSVVELNEDRVIIKIPLSFRSKNHLGSMYFGALCVGADCAGGLIAMRLIQKAGNKVSLVFKDFKAEFLKRPEGDVHFVCEEGQAIKRFVERIHNSTERETMPVHITAYVPEKMGMEPVGKFILGLSLKRRGA